MVCSSSMNRMMFLARRISSITALMRSSNWPRYLVPATIRARSRVMTRLSRSSSGTLPAAISWASPSTMAVLPTPASPSSTGLFLVRRQRIWMTRSISFLRPMTGSISPLRAISVRSRPKAFSAGVLTSPFFSAAGFSGALAGAPFLLGGEIGVQFLQDLLAGLLDVHVQVLQHARGHAVAFAQQAEQDVLGADVGVVERLGFLGGERQHLLDARRVRDVADHLLVRPGADLLLDLHADGFEVEAHLLQDVDGDALAQLDQAQQQVLGADEVVVEPVGFLARQRQHLLGARREIVHGFFAHTCSNCYDLSGLSNPAPAAGGLGDGPADGLAAARAACRPEQIAFLGGQFLRMLLLQVRRLGQDEQLVHQRPVHAREQPRSTPSRISDSRFMVSLEEMLWALARMP